MNDEKAALPGAALPESAAAKPLGLAVDSTGTGDSSAPLTLAALSAALRDYNIATVTDNTDAWWKACADRAIEYLAAVDQPFSADQVQALIPPADHPSRIGARFHAAVRAGVIRPVGVRPQRAPEPSQGRSAALPGRGCPMTPPMGAAALALTSNDWRVLPLNGKAPRTAHGVDDATTDPDIVRRWWARWPQANVGARVPRGVVVVDVDPQHGGPDALVALERAHGALPRTLTVWSGRGDGSRHLYFRRPAGDLVGKLGRGIDVKRDNSFMVMPPSRHPDTGAPYRWERQPAAEPPEWLCRLLVRPPVQRREFVPVLTDKGAPLVRYVSRLAEGGRNGGLFWAACRAAEQRLGEQVLEQLVQAAVSIGLPEVEARRTVHSACRRTGVAA